jgi:hypothetical protein
MRDQEWMANTLSRALALAVDGRLDDATMLLDEVEFNLSKFDDDGELDMRAMSAAYREMLNSLVAQRDGNLRGRVEHLERAQDFTKKWTSHPALADGPVAQQAQIGVALMLQDARRDLASSEGRPFSGAQTERLLLLAAGATAPGSSMSLFTHASQHVERLVFLIREASALAGRFRLDDAGRCLEEAVPLASDMVTSLDSYLQVTPDPPAIFVNAVDLGRALGHLTTGYEIYITTLDASLGGSADPTSGPALEKASSHLREARKLLLRSHTGYSAAGLETPARITAELAKAVNADDEAIRNVRLHISARSSAKTVSLRLAARFVSVLLLTFIVVVAGVRIGGMAQLDAKSLGSVLGISLTAALISSFGPEAASRFLRRGGSTASEAQLRSAVEQLDRISESLSKAGE